ncbi:MAG: RidA family protein [Gammaproteobacteria bacterium]|nr:RidA family protein [Gammaproteobacteria bacterium]MDH4315739.1 RidA family protein [Gammaproteobacteria bacterium]MDH5214155.1 RidA family protein [Gammaproteobacteria bacterium]
MTKSRRIDSALAPPPVGAYPHARQHGNLLFLSGIGPRPPDGGAVPGVTLDAAGEVVDYDIDAQCHAVFANVRAVLQSASASWEDLLDVTVYLTDIKRDFLSFNRIWADYFRADGPSRTTVEVARLPTPIAIELKCIAAAPPAGSKK